MESSIKKIDERVNQGLIKEVKLENLSLYNYTAKCQYNDGWDKWTRMCGGLVYDNLAKKIVVLPLEKFFNLNEVEETKIENLPSDIPEVTSKADGSLILVSWYNNELLVHTRGSFNSEQAVWARKYIKQNCRFDNCFSLYGITLLFEAIYPENRIVVDYEDKEGLILVGARNIKMGYDYGYNMLKMISDRLGLELVEKFDFSIEQLLTMQKHNKGIEGFVLRYSNGLRVKVKTDEYFELHRIINSLTPLNIWKCMKDNWINANVKRLDDIPDRLRQEASKIFYKLDDKKLDVLVTAMKDFRELYDKTNSDKEFALAVREKFSNKLSQAVQFAFKEKNLKRVDSIIWKIIKPVNDKERYENTNKD